MEDDDKKNQLSTAEDGTPLVAGIAVCPEEEHDWKPVPTAHPSITGQLFECARCLHVRTVGP